MNQWYRSYVQILKEAAQYQRLSDAGEYYREGKTQIWYRKATSTNKINVNDLSRTHSMIGTLDETNPEAVLSMMQSESWDTDNNAENMLNRLGVQHSGMTSGDVIVIDNIAHVITNNGIVQKDLAA